ncbi:hypothetical protein HJG60_009562 [Phyllostomus discolor]|uniref:Uncharacterized protein n=1 Tax=Phyllostomus discolor TaxID=89673 RepID=A0A833YFR0_9CHIR|nr:hypothetical protein HJG60_009562 [Phyllostomus discolor]
MAGGPSTSDGPRSGTARLLAVPLLLPVSRWSVPCQWKSEPWEYPARCLLAIRRRVSVCGARVATRGAPAHLQLCEAPPPAPDAVPRGKGAPLPGGVLSGLVGTEFLLEPAELFSGQWTHTPLPRMGEGSLRCCRPACPRAVTHRPHCARAKGPGLGQTSLAPRPGPSTAGVGAGCLRGSAGDTLVRTAPPSCHWVHSEHPPCPGWEVTGPRTPVLRRPPACRSPGP